MITDRHPSAAGTLQSRVHAQCLVCGAEHPLGLHLVFQTHSDGHVEATFCGDRLLQGYTGYLHGGVIAALLDGAMTNCLFAHGRVAVTGELSVKFLKPVPVHYPATVHAWIAQVLRPLYYMAADLRQNGEVVARATAKFMESPRSDS